MYVFGGFDGIKRNDIYRILFDNEERKKNLQEQENRSFTRSFSMINQSMADELMQDGYSDYSSLNQGEVVGQNLV
jgi:hypothetical protein